jgi:Deoxyribonuclease II
MEETIKKLPAPTPMAGKDQPVDWLFVYKFNAASYPGCTDDGVVPAVGSPGIFGGTVQQYKSGHSQQYVFATNKNPTLVKGEECIGATLNDPLGATFAQVYNNPGYYYVLWNDQFYNNPIKTEGSPMGHSKGMVAWNEDGEGFVLQVSTPSWPASGSKAHPRQNDGNTLGCIIDDDVEVAQHFFAVKINKDDLVLILKAIGNASVVTSTAHPEIVQNGGPADVQELVKALGSEFKSTTCTVDTLSSGITLISKPSALAVPPWQLVSAQLGGLPLRVASWWAEPLIYSTTAGTAIACWPDSLGKPGPVAIATTGTWDGKSIGLTGGEGTNFNHAKLGVSTDSTQPLCIFGDMNQQGALSPGYAYEGQKCSSSQNGRGGTFYVLENKELFASLTALLKGDTAPESGPNGE